VATGKAYIVPNNRGFEKGKATTASGFNATMTQSKLVKVAGIKPE